MRRRIGWALVAAAALLLAGALYVAVAGLVLVSDHGADVVAASVVTSDGREQRLHRLPGGRFAGIPSLEGTVEVRCRDGSADAHGYVTGGLHTRIVVERGPAGRGCQARDG